MKQFYVLTLSTILVLSTFLAGSVSSAAAKDQKILEFDTMVGIPQAFTGTQNPIRTINGGGLPWKLTSAEGKLTTSGRLKIEIKGLVLAAGPNAGSNPSTITSFRAIVSCLTSDGGFENILTDPFPATTGPASAGGGNAEIEATVNLPQPCIAPIIFVTNPAGNAWFASTGF